MLVGKMKYIIRLLFVITCFFLISVCGRTENISSFFKDYPLLKDSVQLISYLQSSYNCCLSHEAKGELNGKITAFEKFKLNGSEANFYLLEYSCIKEGCMADYPWKYQFVFTERGELLKSFSAIRFSLLNVFSGENPYLLLTLSTAKGNGGHELYKITFDSLENVYEGYYDCNVSTYDAYEDISVFSPYELNLKLEDINKDGYNDLVFSGQIVFLMKKNENSDFWYDVENGVSFTEDNPAKVVPVSFIFLYDKATGHFKEYEPYANKSIKDYY